MPRFPMAPRSNWSKRMAHLTKAARGPLMVLAAVAGALSPGLAFTEDRETDDPPSARPASTRSAASTAPAIPACLEKIKLSPSQQDKIKSIVREYDEDLASVWKQFGDRYMETVRTEAALLAAIEDNLTEPQRKQVRDQRRKTAQHQKSLASTDSEPNKSTEKPDSPVERELTIVGVSLSAEQEVAADKLQEKCLSHLRSLNRDVQGLHTRLVSLEADKLVEIEAVLTKEQLKELREIRQNMPIAPRVAVGQVGRAQSE